MAALAALLPTPVYTPSVDEEEEVVQTAQSSSQVQTVVIRSVVPAYGQRNGWRPSSQEDYGDGGAYPECHIAQYPLEMGKKKASSGNTLALQVDSEGNVRYDAIAHQGQRPDKIVQSQFKDLVPLHHRKDLDDADRTMDRPTEDEVQATADKTRAALEKLVNGKIKAAQPKNVPDAHGKTSFIRYTPGQQNGADGLKQRIIKMTEVVEDPLEPPRFKHKKIPRGPPSPPPPVLRSPPRKATAQEQKEWMIPPCISNWKNNKGYTIPLDKRLAADGRGLQDVHINDNFAKFSEALFIADRHAREEVRQRALMQQKLAEKEKAAKEENLRLLAQRAREERAGIPASRVENKPAADRVAAMKSSLGAYGSDSGSESEAEDEGDGEDEEAAKIRDMMREEKKREREREMRMSNMGQEQRAKMLARQQNRDISEKIALGLAKPTMSKEAMLDSRLFNQESLSGTFADDEAYNLYDRPLFHGSSAAAAIYKARGNIAEGNDESFGGGTEEGIGKALDNDRFGLGQAKVGFEGAQDQEIREGPVQFEKDTGDVFGLDKFLDEAKSGKKRGLDTEVDIRQEYVDKVKHLADAPLHSMDYARKVTVYGCKWPADEEYDRSMKYFRKYVKPILVAAAVDYEMINGRRHGDLTERIANDIKKRRRLLAGIDELPPLAQMLRSNTPEAKQMRELEGGIVIVGRPTFKEYMAGLKRGWTESLEIVDKEENLARTLASDGKFDEPEPEPIDVGVVDGEPIPTASKLQPSKPLPVFTPPHLKTSSSSPPNLQDRSSIPDALNAPPPTIPPQPPLLLVSFLNHIGLTQIPSMIWEFFQRTAQGSLRCRGCSVMSSEPTPAQPYAMDPLSTDLDFDKEVESYYKTSIVKSFKSDIEKVRQSYYNELAKKLEIARDLARGTREPTKDEISYPPPTEVELRSERLKKELRWHSDEAGWNIVKPDSSVDAAFQAQAQTKNES
ncbi:hypothetical protein EW026_g2489 [Hermanssonia centrifuga]|uniref:Mitochondrial import inner membrane translocase subunit TIM54 n=1 Tax=Hermanssonia centrifuga TaxID=98765 RepID=A0A4S4KN72_9APHY|nr:hypothetical protein EW026_g2489 [Hermanssonia centrifuga]